MSTDCPRWLLYQAMANANIRAKKIQADADCVLQQQCQTNKIRRLPDFNGRPMSTAYYHVYRHDPYLFDVLGRSPFPGGARIAETPRNKPTDARKLF